MIFFADLARTGAVHINVNASLIKLACTIYGDNFIVFSEKKHSVFLKEKLSNYEYQAKVFFCPNKLPDNSFIKLIIMLFRECIFVLSWFRICFYSYIYKPKIVFVLSVMPVTHYVLKHTLFLLKVDCNLVVVLHGEVESIITKPNTYYSLLLKALKKKTSRINFSYIVLSNSIKSNIIKFFKVDPSTVIAINHPYDYNYEIDISQGYKKPIIVGSIGVHHHFLKNSGQIFELAKLFKDEVEKGLIKFKTIGKYENDMRQYVNEYVEMIGADGEMLSDQEFNRNIQSLDYVIFFNPTESYKFIASGTFFDAVKYCIPIIALKNDSVLHYAELAGELGYLINNFEEMGNAINHIIYSNSQEEYLQIRKNLKSAQKIFSSDEILKSLKEQLVINKLLAK